ncbi:ribosome small subunit-dependent GTPase A [Phenylobacterium sp.]|uniref:ribosome small subunit-dependent GTPase A n=1 Tax=Phenylobacterium sp. TaxID=1871053 RepID=UPI002BB38BF7|nr:ribosome small subunit-dependent GTPase A [Phenylobacterium sp.]HLZ74670.1 ribosome small subunit-dependent GTPase A [Phenylobacterium sp.]
MTQKETLTLLSSYGWSPALQHDFEPYAARGLVPARVIVQQRNLYRLVTDAGETEGRISGLFRHEAAAAFDLGAYPVTGDWVAVELKGDAAVIAQVLPRATAFTRMAAGTAKDRQVVAANVDMALLAASLNADLNLRRLERYLATAYESGAAPVILLTKADACDDPEPLIAQVEAIAFGVPVLSVSVRTGQGLDALSALLAPGKTAVLLGSSGVGKSTLVNALAGVEKMATKAIREDDAHGRHTTTHRELILLPSGALILDTPGMRELALWDAEAGLAAAFAETTVQIEEIAQGCRFRDCAHDREPGCAVRAALADGTLDPDRWQSFQKLQRELAHAERKEDPLAAQAERKRWAAVHKSARAWTKTKREIDD